MKNSKDIETNNASNIENSLIKVTQKEERDFLKEFNFWSVLEPSEQSHSKARELHRVYEFNSFDTAFEFMTIAVKEYILVQNHHPRWENSFKQVQVWLSTFDLQGEISNKDIKLAKDLEKLWESLH